MSGVGNSLPSRAEAGFTLFEALVALAIMSLVAGIGFPSLQHLLARRAIDEGTLVVKMALAQARADAVREDSASTLTLAENRHRLRFSSGRPDVLLPDKLAVALPYAGFAFLPDGTSSGGVVTISIGDRVRRIGIDPVNSRIAERP